MNSKIQITLSENRKDKPSGQLGFGNKFTDHMFVMDYNPQENWHNPRIVPYAPISLYPSAKCLHYGQEIFEGMKAYRTNEGKIQLFRPDKNFIRFNESCDRICIPKIDVDFMLEALKTLVDIDKDWVPSQDESSLYIRPFIIATDDSLGVAPSETYQLYIILSPSGSYYKNGIQPVKIHVETNYVRAVRGGVGSAKTGGNYAASFKAQDLAAKNGYEQVLWLDAIERKYIEEVGAMNVFFKIGNEVITPKLQGSILPGVTRSSVVEILQDWNVDIHERPLSIEELITAYNSGLLEEAWGSGTAAVISPIGELRYKDKILRINNGNIGSLSQRIYDELTGIQWGKIPDNRNWIVSL